MRLRRVKRQSREHRRAEMNRYSGVASYHELYIDNDIDMM